MLGLVGLALGAVLAVWAGAMLINDVFMLYDDEGYILISLKNFSAHGGLYDRVYSQYGPFFYLLYDGLHRLLGFEWTHAASRAITLVNWIGAAALCAGLVWRCTRSKALTLFVFLDVFIYLWVMINEPIHPGGLLSLGVALAAALGAEGLRRPRLVFFAATAGAIGAGLALVKINVGGFLVIAAGLWLLCATPGRPGVAGRWAAMLIGATLPFALMSRLLPQPWIATFIAVSILAVLAVLIVVAPVARGTMSGIRPWLAFVAAGAGVMLIVTGLIVGRGTSPQSLLEGVLLAPMRQPDIYSFPLRWRPLAIPVALACFGLVVACRARPMDRRLMMAVAWLRIAVTAAFLLTLLPALATSQAAIGLCYGVSLAALFALPLPATAENEPEVGMLARIKGWLALILVFQAQQAFPVAGSQLNWGTFLWVPLMLLGFHEAITFVSAGWRDSMGRSLRLAVRLALALVALTSAGHLALTARGEFASTRPMSLPGAEEMRLPDVIGTALQIVTTNASAHGDMLFSLPGSFSLNLWSGLPTPTLRNVTHWFSLLDESEQREIIRAIETDSRPVFVVQHNILGSLLEKNYRARGVLMDFLPGHFERAFAIEGYSFWVRRGRTVAPLNLGRLEHPVGSGPDEQHLRLILPAGARRIGRVELTQAGTVHPLLSLDASNAIAESTPIHADGMPGGGPARAGWPVTRSSLQHLRLRFALVGSLPPPETLIVRLRDEQGKELSTVRLVPASALSPAAGTCLLTTDGDQHQADAEGHR